MDAQILLVEDDTIARQMLATVLEDAGYSVVSACDGTVALDYLQKHTFDVVITDIRMREIDGIEVLNVARSQPYLPEVILLTGYGSLETAVAALRGGAFNYLVKPCNSTELIDCVAAALKQHTTIIRRHMAMRMIAEEYVQLADLVPTKADPTNTVPVKNRLTDQQIFPPSQRVLIVGALHIDNASHLATLDGQPLRLTPTEFTILRCLAESPNQVLMAEEIVRHSHGHIAGSPADAQAMLRSHVRNLRRKIGRSYLVTVRGMGYMLVDPTSE